MNQVNQGESSGGQSVYPIKRRRGRPRKDPGQMAAAAALVPPDFDRERQYAPQRADRTGETHPVVGQALTGVVDGTFNDGYMISVRIGNSQTNLRGVVFKPGHFLPVKAEYDVAPHLPMIRRSSVHPPAGSHGGTQSAPLAGNQDGTQSAPPAGNQDGNLRQVVIVHTEGPTHRGRKRKKPQTVSAAPLAGVRGTVVPVVLQPVNLVGGSNPKPSDLSPSAMIAFMDKDVHNVESLAMLPDDHTVPASQIFQGPQLHINSHQTPQGTEQTVNKPCKEGSSDVGNTKAMESADAYNSAGGTSDTQTGTKEALKTSAEKSSIFLKQETGDVHIPISTDKFFPHDSVPTALLHFGTGKMTQLLQAVQEKLKDKQVQTDFPAK